MVTKDETARIENAVRAIAKEHIAPMSREKLVALLMLAANNIGVNILERQPESVVETAAAFELGLQTLLDMYNNSKPQTPTQIEIGLISSAVGHA